jgi:hypothetical protein
MGSDERWPTLELIQAAVDRFVAQLPGWSFPEAYGVALVPTLSFPPKHGHLT